MQHIQNPKSGDRFYLLVGKYYNTKYDEGVIEDVVPNKNKSIYLVVFNDGVKDILKDGEFKLIDWNYLERKAVESATQKQDAFKLARIKSKEHNFIVD